MNRWIFGLSLACCLTLLSEEELFTPALETSETFHINLKDPTFSQGTISTESGGIITAEDLRIQAKKIAYTNRIENGIAIKKVVAEGDLLIETQGRAFVGEKLEYDLIHKTATVWEGRTSTDFWYVGGEKIEIAPDGSFTVTNAFITTVEGQDNWWELRSSHIGISQKDLLNAKNIRFRFFKIPIFWLPSFKVNLKWVKDSPIRYKFIWDQLLKQKLSLRYEIYSSEQFDLYGRFDYQFKYGPGAAIETEYRSPDGRTLFQTKNYGAYNKIIPQENGNKRYRLQGIYTTESKNEKTHVHMTYDKLSDDKMPQDFKNDDFELNTQKRTIFWVTHQNRDLFGKFTLQPRINWFQSINQQLPLITGGLRPLTLGKSGIITDNWFSLGYLDYVFAKPINQDLPSTKSARLETNNSFYRPLPLGPLTLTPSTGLIGIFYSNTPQSHATGQGMVTYGLKVHTDMTRKYASIRHEMTPYLNFQGNTKPTSPNANHYIFDLYDGYTPLNQLRFGVKQGFFSVKHLKFLPDFSIDLFAYSFFGKTAFDYTTPKAYTQFELRRPSILIRSGISYNIQESSFDYTNILTEWTASQDFALSVEFRHRGKYAWRKADPDNFYLEVQRPIPQLLHSPLSDGRNTLLTKFQLRFSPLWTAHLESHHGWGRRDQPNYNEFALKLMTLVTGGWHLELGVSYDPAKKWESVTPSFKLVR